MEQGYAITSLERPSMPRRGPAYSLQKRFLDVAGSFGLLIFLAPTLLLIALAVTSVGGIGTSVCYHRCLAHRSLRLNRVIENVLIFFTILNASGEPMSWVANHRHHH